MLDTRLIDRVKEYNYLLTSFCPQDGYWDTSGYCHWSKDAQFYQESFDLDDEDGLAKALADLKHDHAEYSISIVKNLDWHDDEQIVEHISNIEERADEMVVRREEDEKIEAAKKKKKELEERREKLRQKELSQLEELKKKYEENNGGT